MRRIVTGILLVLALVAASAQERDYQPSCAMCPGTYVPNTEIQAYVKRAMANSLTDQQIRQVDIGKASVGVAVVHRPRQTAPAAVVAEHDLVSEVYHVISGGGTLLLGPDLVGKVRRNPNDNTVRLLNGPGNNAAAIRNGVSYDLKQGDVSVSDCTEQTGRPAFLDCIAARGAYAPENAPDLPTRALDAYRKLGNAFVVLGGGLSLPVGGRAALQFNLNAQLMMPAVGVVLQPSLGMSYSLP